jgi:hypothetical protein
MTFETVEGLLSLRTLADENLSLCGLVPGAAGDAQHETLRLASNQG